MKSSSYHIESLDHLGLVAGMCKELGIAAFFDELLPNQSPYKNISYGETVVAMILNGLGFTARTLHMFPEFHANKPLDKLIRNGLKPDHINDKVLGRTLDKLYELGVSSLYSMLAQKVVKKLKLKCRSINMDTTSFHVDGQYDVDKDTKAINICHGHSRDHRPDLKQAILLLITENKAGIPLFMKASSGNINDTTNFNQLITAHIKSMKAALNHKYLIADAALYCAANIKKLHEQKQYFISRVPAKLKEASELIKNSHLMSFNVVDGSPTYKVSEVASEYGDVTQRWLIFYSSDAARRDLKALNARMLRQSKKETKALNKLCKEVYACKEDAIKAFNHWRQSVNIATLT